MANDTGPLLNEIGNLLSRDIAYPRDGTFLYVEAGEGWVDMSIFKDLGDHLLWRYPMDGLDRMLLDIWEAGAPGKRWLAMQYRISGDAFEASFTYDPLDPTTAIDRRERVLRQRYGNKRIVYPPMPL